MPKSVFFGTYDATIDDKGRVRLPIKFKDQLVGDFYVMQGSGNFLCVYPEESWNALTEAVLKKDSLDEDVELFRRSLFGNTVEGKIDNAGRVLIPQKQRAYANLTKELSVVGNYDHFEIWDAATLNDMDYSSAKVRSELQKKVASKKSE